MNWDELSTRLAQEARKKADLARHRLGVKPATIAIRDGVAEGRFFFEQGEADERAHLLQEALPERANEIVREAKEICAHNFRLLGYENLDFGREIDWHLDRVHNRHSRLDPWFKIPFLDFGLVGDHKVIWELNRHQHLVTLGKAWLLTQDEKYVRELMAQWRSWTAANPYPLGINWGSSLEVAFRSLSWVWVDHMISDAPGYEKFRDELLPALAFHGQYINRYLSTYFSPNTHLLGEAVALLFLGTVYPQMAPASRWKKSGWGTVVREAGRQVRPDGVYFEQSLYYHVYALDFFLYARQLAATNDLTIPPGFDEVLLKMLNVVQVLAQAGPAEGFGDDDGGRVFDPRRNLTEHLTDPLTLGSLVFHRDDLSAARLTEESIWLFGERAIRELCAPEVSRTAKSVAFPYGGIYVLTDSSPFPQVMMVDAGPQGVGRCGHGHADALSVRLTMNGRRWLIDSGSGVYISSDEKERNFFRGTRAHNTVKVDSLDQAIPGEPFSWTGIPRTSAERWVLGRTFTFFCGSHDGYRRLEDPVTHQRSILRVNANGDDGLSFIRDVLVGSAEHEIEQNWHFGREVSIERASKSEFVARMDQVDQPLLRVIIPTPSLWTAEILEGQVSPAYGRYETTPVLRCRAQMDLPTELGTAFVTETRTVRPPGELQLTSSEYPLVHVYELRGRERRHEFFFARGNQVWSVGSWSSDAAVIYCRSEGQRITQLIVIGASEVTWAGQQLFEATGPLEFLEWRNSDGFKNTGPIPVSTTHQFEILTQIKKTSSDSTTSSHSYAEKR